ncbi:VG15 protein [Streptomyces vinaceus]|uniref:VG15 protein n=1 Tax=Streptomyces vinaceus TaxID=1960 RepID=UPI0036C15DD9
MSKQRESDRARRFFQRAQAALGAEAYRQTLQRVERTNPADFLKDPLRWALEWHQDIEVARKKSRRLGQSYYRLERAIWLDETINHDSSFGQPTTKAELWNELYEAGGSNQRLKPGTVTIPTKNESPWADYTGDKSLSEATTAVHFKAERRVRKAEREALRKQELTLESLDELDDLLDSIGTNLAGEAQSIVEDGGRDVIGEGVDNDPGALAYMRVTDGNACYFCVMLASRGAVYRSKSTAGHSQIRKFHPNCGCSAVPIFSRKYDYPQETKDAVALWKEHWNGSMKDWRKAIEALNMKNR